MNILITLFVLSLIPYFVLGYCFFSRKGFNYRLVMGRKELSINVEHYGFEPVSVENPFDLSHNEDEISVEENPIVSPHVAERNRLYDAKMKVMQEEIDLYKETRPLTIYDEVGEDIDKRLTKMPEHEYAR